MNDHTSVAEESSVAFNCAEEFVEVGDLVAGCSHLGSVDLAVFAAEVAKLAGIGRLIGTFVGIGDIVGIKMTTCSSAVSVFWDSGDVNVIC